jgi:hypothetical protein
LWHLIKFWATDQLIEMLGFRSEMVNIYDRM